MRASLTILFCTTLLVTGWAQEKTVDPAVPEDNGGDEYQKSPKGAFSLIQHYEEETQDQNWGTKLHFEKGAHPDVTLTNTWMWPAIFYISPDDHWVLQEQKSGSGENVAMLFRVDAKGTVERAEPHFLTVAFDHLERTRGIRFDDLFHTGMEFKAWDLEKGVIRFSIFGTPVNGGESFRHEMVYDLATRKVRFEGEAAPALPAAKEAAGKDAAVNDATGKEGASSNGRPRRSVVPGA